MQDVKSRNFIISCNIFNVHGSVYRNNILIYEYIQQDVNVTQFILSGNCSTCFGWYHHPSSGAQTTVSTASGICHTLIDTCRYRGGVGTGLSVLRTAHSKQFRQFQPAITV